MFQNKIQKGIRDGQGHSHMQYLQEGVQEDVPKQDPQGIKGGQGHRYMQYLQEDIPEQDPQGIRDGQGEL